LDVFPKIEITADQRQIFEHADRFAREQLHPLQERMDNEEWWPPDLMKKIAGVGLTGITAPEKWGGAALDLFTSALVAQAFGKWNPAVALSWGASENLCMNNILRNASEELKARYLPGLIDASLMGALALTEPGAGSDALSGMRTTAKRDGNHYVLNGNKIFITNGPIADVILVYAKTAPELGAKGISAFVVEKGFPGFSVAQKMVKMGWRGSQTGELVFNNCRVPAGNLVGAENAGVSIVMSGLNLERAYFATIAVGMAERALDLSLDYARSRRQFGKAIGEFQIIQAKLARHVCRPGKHAQLRLPRGGGSQRPGDRRRRPRRDPQVDRRRAAACRQDLHADPRRGRADPRRQRLDVGDGSQSALSCRQAAGNRWRHQRGTAHHYQRRVAESMIQKNFPGFQWRHP
jgi:isovaleryl-CoA dehydrogenase